jgi:excisionase family DNA binding protein
MTPPEPLYTVEQVAEYLQCSPEAVRDRIAEGRLRAAVVGSMGRRGKRAYRIRQRWLDEFIDTDAAERARQLEALTTPVAAPKRPRKVRAQAGQGQGDGPVLRMPERKKG